MSRGVDISGEIFSRLTVIEKHGKRGERVLWKCLCVCGNSHYATTSDLRYGSVKSCGCLLSGKTAKNSIHNNSSRRLGASRTYNSWRGMINRCKNKTHVGYKYYGKRGISVCDRWEKFENFLTDMGDRPSGMSIDRIDVNGNYCKENCRWADANTQRRNRSDSSNILEKK